MTTLVDSVRCAGEHRSPGFAALWKQVEDLHQTAVLDLGPASGTNVAFFAKNGCHLHVADLYRSLAETTAGPGVENHTFARACRHLLPPPEEGPFDIILAWDLLNYLGETEISILASSLRTYCRPGTELFASLSIRSQIPSRPLGYQIVAADRLHYGEPSPIERSGPDYKQTALLRLLPGFTVKRCFLLRNGLKEYVLRYEAGI